MQDYKSTNFSEYIADHLDGVSYTKRGNSDIRNFPVIKGKQCLYVMNWKKSKITYADGIKEMLGYEDSDFTMDLALNYFHPDDLNFVNRIIKGIVTHSVTYKFSALGQYFILTFRLRKADGTYIRVLRNSTSYEVDKEGKLISHFSMLTDLSFC